MGPLGAGFELSGKRVGFRDLLFRFLDQPNSSEFSGLGLTLTQQVKMGSLLNFNEGFPRYWKSKNVW